MEVMEVVKICGGHVEVSGDIANSSFAVYEWSYQDEGCPMTYVGSTMMLLRTRYQTQASLQFVIDTLGNGCSQESLKLQILWSASDASPEEILSKIAALEQTWSNITADLEGQAAVGQLRKCSIRYKTAGLSNAQISHFIDRNETSLQTQMVSDCWLACRVAAQLQNKRLEPSAL